MGGLGSRTTASPDAFDVERVLVAFTLPHRGHDGIPGASDDSCLRCNAERALDRIAARCVRAEEALRLLIAAAEDIRGFYGIEADPGYDDAQDELQDAARSAKELLV